MSKPLNFQTIIMKLQEFWAKQGCLIWQPYYTQVGAGTMNPATALRVLGPEPWNVAYVEPSIRPDDARYGENPNRMQMHYQFQVILKPDPGNPQELYLMSLEALGIDPRQHDIRFVEDNWESPALGAWGLGWEVWLDGQEITQFTYFQQSGGQVLDPVSVELTYGLERIAIALQRVSGFQEIQWSPALTDGDVNLQAEREHSKYYFEVADVERLRQMFNLFADEANSCLELGLVLPAHDYVLKCSHTFNILDTRGAVGVTERQAFFARMRDQSRRVAEAYVEQRRLLGFPWGDASSEVKAVSKKIPSKEITIAERDTPSDFLLEIGTEELPVDDLKKVLGDVEFQFKTEIFDIYHLGYEDFKVYGTPRRIVLSIKNLQPKAQDSFETIKGPPASIAFDEHGNPTQALIGWAKKYSLPVDILNKSLIKEIEGGQYVTYLKPVEGENVIRLLSGVLPAFLNRLSFDKSMRWNSSNVAFSRPIRWILALYGDQVVSFEYAELVAADVTRGLRLEKPKELQVENPDDYLRIMSEQGIILNVAERKRRIETQIRELAKEVGGIIPNDPELLEEVANLVEAPMALRGTFDASHLQLPNEVLTAVMKKHQRYFPIEKNGKLLPYFIFVANKPGLLNIPDEELCKKASMIVDGNEHVIRARFADAAYFIKEDLKHELFHYYYEEYKLGNLTFHPDLGSMTDKTRRIMALVPKLAKSIGLNKSDADAAARAANLCKADLATSMVIEMTSLQGVMGKYYALQSGEKPEVAEAIYEHYLPRFPGDDIPKTRPGLVVGLADRLDTLVGLFAVGITPTGAKDPYGLRRAALGLLQNMIAWDVNLSLNVCWDEASSTIGSPQVGISQKACVTFIIERLRNLLLDQGNRYDNVDAILVAQGEYPARAARAIEELSKWVARPDWNTILPAFARCVRITRDFETVFNVNTELFKEEAEQALYRALLQAEANSRSDGSVDDFLDAFVPMIGNINRFFDEVLVMNEDELLRSNRLGLLQRIVALSKGVIDMSKLEGF